MHTDVPIHMRYVHDLLVTRQHRSPSPIPVSAECQTSRMDKQRQSSAAAFPLSWVSEDDPCRKVSFEYPPDQLTHQAQAIYDKDPIRTAHVDQFKEDYLELDEYTSVILEYGELPDPDHCKWAYAHRALSTQLLLGRGGGGGRGVCSTILCCVT